MTTTWRTVICPHPPVKRLHRAVSFNSTPSGSPPAARMRLLTPTNSWPTSTPRDLLVETPVGTQGRRDILENPADDMSPFMMGWSMSTTQSGSEDGTSSSNAAAISPLARATPRSMRSSFAAPMSWRGGQGARFYSASAMASPPLATAVPLRPAAAPLTLQLPPRGHCPSQLLDASPHYMSPIMVGTPVCTPANAPTTTWRTNICPYPPTKRSHLRIDVTPSASPVMMNGVRLPTPSNLWPSSRSTPDLKAHSPFLTPSGLSGASVFSFSDTLAQASTPREGGLLPSVDEQPFAAAIGCYVDKEHRHDGELSLQADNSLSVDMNGLDISRESAPQVSTPEPLTAGTRGAPSSTSPQLAPAKLAAVRQEVGLSGRGGKLVFQ